MYLAGKNHGCKKRRPNLTSRAKTTFFARRPTKPLALISAKSASGDFLPDKKIAGWSHHSPPNGGSSVSADTGGWP